MVQHRKLGESLRRLERPQSIHYLENLYYQESRLRFDNNLQRRSARGVLSLPLFNLSFENVFWKTFVETDKWYRKTYINNGVWINNIGYTVDTMMISGN